MENLALQLHLMERDRTVHIIDDNLAVNHCIRICQGSVDKIAELVKKLQDRSSKYSLTARMSPKQVRY